MSTRVITVGFSRRLGFAPLSWLIMKVQRTTYSHTYLRWSTPWGFDEILEASGTSVKMVEQKGWAEKNQIIKEVDVTVTKEQFNLVMTHIRSKTGTPYGFKQLVGLGLKQLLNLEKNPFGDGDRTWVCSELVGKFLLLVTNWDADLDDISPDDIEHELESLE